jgi:hypothetical protein
MRHIKLALLVCSAHEHAICESSRPGHCTLPTGGGAFDADSAVRRIDRGSNRHKECRASDFSHLAGVDASQVVAVADTAICHRAAIALAHAESTDLNPPLEPVWVWRVGTDRYVVFVTGHNSGELLIA